MNRYQIALYIRLSMDDARNDSMSIPNQRLILHEKALNLPEGINADIREFVDNGYSGTNFERPAMQELLTLVQSGKIDCIMVKDFSRFGRNSIETGYFIERVFPLYHTRFISVSDDFDSNSYHGTTGGIDVAFRYLINEAYSKDMSLKNRSAKYAMMRRGEYQSVICPYGYRKSADGRMEPNEDTAPVIRQIFQMAADGIKIGDIARQLSATKVPTPGEYRAMHTKMKYPSDGIKSVWQFGTISTILKDERYTGTYVMGKRIIREVGSGKIKWRDESEWFKIPDHHPAIVSTELYQKANQSLHHIPHTTEKRHEYPLRGKVFCGYCGHPMGRYGKHEDIVKYYCRHGAGMLDQPCHDLRVRASALDQAVLETLKAHTETILGIDLSNCDLSSKTVQLTEYEKKLCSLQEEKRHFYEQYAEGTIAMDVFQKQKIMINAELLKLKNLTASLHEKMKHDQEECAAKSRIQQMVQETQFAETLTKSLVDRMIDKVLVFHDQRIEIQYAFKDFISKAN